VDWAFTFTAPRKKAARNIGSLDDLRAPLCCATPSQVPELTGNADIKLNSRLRLRRGAGAIRSHHRTFPRVSGPTTAKPSVVIFRPAASFQLSETMTARPGFQLVCANCDALAVVLDYAEGAPLSTPINCRYCGALRGTLGVAGSINRNRLASSSANIESYSFAACPTLFASRVTSSHQ